MAPATLTPTDADLLQLIWLASPALPVGGFSYSEGLESAADTGLVTDGDSAALWLLDQLHLGLARSDLAVVCQAVVAWRAGDTQRAGELDAWVLASRETSELRQQTVQMGRSMLAWLTSVSPERVPPGLAAPTYPVAFALAAAAGTAPVRAIGLCFALGWAENMVQAAVRAVPLGQSAGQRMLLQLSAAIPAAVDLALALEDDERQAFTPMLAILCAQHETQYSRLFRS